jgi:photosystem II stability/assembly factor-like uncharacterized protein
MKKSMFLRLTPHTALSLIAALLLSACLLDGSDGSRKSGEAGYVRLSMNLDRTATALGKKAWTDSTFELDSLKLVLTAPGAVTQTYTYAIQGRPDTGAIIVGPGVFALDPLRTWKAKIITLDTNVNPARTDTVHMDSVSFNVLTGDTAVVNLTVKAVNAVLRIRLLSTSSDSLGAGIQFARIRVNGVTRDSLWVIGNEAHNAVLFPSIDTGWVAADAGKIWKSVDSGNTFKAQVSGTSQNLYALWFANGKLGWVAGANGTILRTKDGASWTAMPSGTTAKLNRIMFVSASKGYVAGDGGIILKTIDSGSSWHVYSGGWFSQTSPNSQNMNSVFFKTADSGWAVGGAGNILSTGNSGVTWTATAAGVGALRDVDFLGATGLAVGDGGQIIKKPGVAGWSTQAAVTPHHLYGVSLFDANTGWTVGEGEVILKTTNGGTNWVHQTNGWTAMLSNTTTNLRSINTASNLIGYAVGTGGFITKTTDGGATWTSQTSPTAQDLNTVFASDVNRAYAVGNAGSLIKSNFNGSAWISRTSNTTQNLRDADFFSATQGWVVGDSETVVRTVDSANWGVLPGGWTAEASGIGDTVLAVHFFDGNNGYAVGRNGQALRTTDGGDSWSVLASGKNKPFRGVAALAALTVVAVGDSGIIRRSTNGGGAWTTITPTTPTTDSLRAVNFTSATAGYAVGDGGSVRVTTDGGATWTAKQVLSPVNGSAIFRGVHSNGTYVWVVGAGGLIYQKTPIGAGTMTAVTTPGSSVNLNDVAVITNGVVVAVGDGGLIRRTTTGTNGATSSWSTVGTGLTSATLRRVKFKGTTGTTDTGYAFGDGGVVLKSVDAGATWAVATSAAARDLKAAHQRPGAADSLVIAGSNGYIARTINGGVNWSGKSTLRNFNAVDFVSASTGWIAASDGRVLKTLTGGTRWVVQDSAITSPLRGMYFKDANTGWVVGDNGIIRKTVNGGTAWSTQAAGTFAGKNLLRVHFKGTTDTGWIAGESGTLIRTFDGGTNWRADTTEGSTQALRGVFVRGDTAYTVGDSGIVLRTINRGQTLSGQSPRGNLKAVSSPSSTVAYAVGTGGLILKTSNGGTSWSPLASGVTQTLNSVMFPVDVNNGWAVGAAGKILKTTNGSSWTTTTVGSEDFLRVHFFNNLIGYVSGNNGKIYRTVDGGSNWVAQTSGTTQPLGGVYAFNPDSIWAVGNNGTILKSRDSGVVLTGVNLNSLYFRGDTGYVVGNGGFSIRTGNGGGTWTPITGMSADLYDCFISPSGNNLYTVGVGGAYATASNATAPTAWTVRSSGTTKNLNGIWVSTNTIYAVGDSGVIRSNTSFGDLVNAKTSNTVQPLRAIQCQGITNNCWTTGGNETVVRSTDGTGTTWVVKSTGPKLFDLNLVTKYLKPGVSNTVNLQAIDRSSPLRGYQANYTFTLSPGQDSTITTTLGKCGYGGATPTCTP